MVYRTREGRKGIAMQVFFVIEEVAEFLKTSVKTVRRRISSGELRSFKEGGRVCVLKADLDEYLARKVRETASR